MRFNNQLLKDIIEWDVSTWKHALFFWDEVINELKNRNLKVLELGSRNGGISLYFALNGFNVVCSDLKGPTEKAYLLHKRYNVDKNIEYKDVDATNICFSDNSFDVIVFKSILGGIGRNQNKQLQQKVFNEIHRVLKDNGLFLFAENLVASKFHTVFRKRFVKWGNSWRYVSISEMEEFLAIFSEYKYQTTGFLSAFGKIEILKSFLSKLDNILKPLIKDTDRYLIYGYAKK
jgi:SAM-dependent methyltransferase